MFQTIAGFLLLASLIFYSGKQLSFYGDIIAEHLGLGKAWIGLILMASVTSLPELTVGISSVSIIGSADLALGNILGSCMINFLMLSVLDAFTPQQSIFAKASPSHSLACSMSIILFALVGLALFLPNEVIIYQWIGISSILFIIIYFLSMRILYHYEQKLVLQKAAAVVGEHKSPIVGLKRAVLLYCMNAIIVVGAAMFLPGIAENIARETGLGESIVGTLFLSASTVLPEFAVTIGALRIGAIDLAVGNLIGSNLFNILILAIDEIFYTKGYLLKDASDANLVSVFSVIIMTAIAIGGLTYHNTKKRYLLAWDTLLICVMYVVNLILLYYLKNAA